MHTDMYFIRSLNKKVNVIDLSEPNADLFVIELGDYANGLNIFTTRDQANELMSKLANALVCDDMMELFND